MLAFFCEQGCDIQIPEYIFLDRYFQCNQQLVESLHSEQLQLNIEIEQLRKLSSRFSESNFENLKVKID
jgi:hypothetical protein